RKILQVVSEPFVIQARELFVEASIGIGLYPGDGEDAEMLVANVDTAMYRAKESGRNSYQFFTRRMQEQSQERAAMESGLRRALPNGEFVLHYQPILRLATRLRIGVEALVRWMHPKNGVLLPREFIPLAEEVGLIARLGDWVLRGARATPQNAGFFPPRDSPPPAGESGVSARWGGWAPGGPRERARQ